MIIEHNEDQEKRIEIAYDEIAESPREWYNLGRMYCFHGRYNLGDEHNYTTDMFSSWDEFEDQLYKDHDIAVICPLYLYDHSVQSIKIGSWVGHAVHAEWDSGQVGFIFATKQDIRECYGVKRITRKVIERVRESLSNEVETYDLYIRGECFGFTTYTRCDECGQWEIDESCFGFLGQVPRDEIPEDYHYLTEELDLVA
jgi:hypothetical protein